jgi:uncharacterized damage-inducible protein DinB
MGMEMAPGNIRYPVGEFTWKGPATFAQREHWIGEILEAPEKLRAAVNGLSEARLDTAYREGGWTVRQVVHHLADSHLNAYIRFRLALTENEPTVKPYDQGLWANLEDARKGPIGPSLSLIEALHYRWVLLLKSMKADDFTRTFNHPERSRMTLDQNLAEYAWHGRHHIGHINSVAERLGWR